MSYAILLGVVLLIALLLQQDLELGVLLDGKPGQGMDINLEIQMRVSALVLTPPFLCFRLVRVLRPTIGIEGRPVANYRPPRSVEKQSDI
jgi:hypothetical protein